jgi:hypothetical protein
MPDSQITGAKPRNIFFIHKPENESPTALPLRKIESLLSFPDYGPRSDAIEGMVALTLQLREIFGS